MINGSNIDHSPSLQDNEEALCQACDPTYNDVFTYQNLLSSAIECTKGGVIWKSSVQMFTINRLQWVSNLYHTLVDCKYKSKGFRSFYLNERGKTRHIQSVHVSERAVQKALNTFGLKPIIEPKLIYDNGASRNGKGTLFALERLRRHLSTHFRKYGKQGGVLTLDIHDYFNSIPHDKLKAMLREVIVNDDLYNQVAYFIDCFEGDTGIGLGSEISQMCAIFYPNIVDHYIKEQLHIKGYGRYMDDMYIIHQDLDYLRECKEKIEQMLFDLGLTLNPKTKITKLDGGVFVFLKRRFSLSDSGKVITRLLRKNITKRRRILKKQKKLLDQGKADIQSIHQSYQSWRGYAFKWDTRKTVRSMDRLYYDLFNDDDPSVDKFYTPHKDK